MMHYYEKTVTPQFLTCEISGSRKKEKLSWHKHYKDCVLFTGSNKQFQNFVFEFYFYKFDRSVSFILVIFLTRKSDLLNDLWKFWIGSFGIGSKLVINHKKEVLNSLSDPVSHSISDL